MFPEGGIRTTGEICPFKKGAFHVAVNAQLPILPLVFSSYYHFMSKAEKRFNSGKDILDNDFNLEIYGNKKKKKFQHCSR